MATLALWCSTNRLSVGLLELLGDGAWAFPSWLDRRLPRFAIEHDGPGPQPPAARPALEDA